MTRQPLEHNPPQMAKDLLKAADTLRQVAGRYLLTDDQVSELRDLASKVDEFATDALDEWIAAVSGSNATCYDPE